MQQDKKNFPDFSLAELHAHLGASISPAILWQIAHDQGIKLPKKEFQEFRNHITLSPQRKIELNEYFRTVYHTLLDPLSSGTHAVEHATYNIMADSYREGGISLIELRSNPMKHNNGDQVDLDHIIMGMLRGMERALLEYKALNAGLIFCMAREFSVDQNYIIADKAIKYHRRGVVGLDVAGPADANFHLKDYEHIFARARQAGLGITIHSGEVVAANDIWEALEYAQATRIGHGIRAAYDKPLMRELAKRGTVLEVCPLSNIATKAVEDMDEIRHILRTFIDNNVRFVINTDWPEIIEGCHLRDQFAMLLREGILSEDELRACNQHAFDASFIPKPGGLNAYL